MWACVHFHSQGWDLIWCRSMQALCILPQTPWAYTCFSPDVFRRLCSLFAWCSPSLWCLQFFCLIFHRVLWPTRGEKWMRYPIYIPWSLSLCSLSSCVSLFLYTKEGRIPDVGWARHWSQYSRLALGIVCCYIHLAEQYYLVFFQVPRLSSFRPLVSQAVLAMSSVVSLKTN